NLTYADLTEAAIREAKRRVIDSIAIAFAGYDEQPSRIAREIGLRCTSRPGATILGSTHRTTPDYAAFANGTMIHSQDFMDTYLSRESLHPSDTIAAVLATAEYSGRTGADVILGTVLTYEVMCRLADIANVRERGWDHVVFGAIASALGAAKMLNQTAEQMRETLALAVVANTALRQTRVGEVPMWKALAPSNASRNGVLAAMLAQAGVTGPVEAFVGAKGFERQVSGPLHFEGFGSKSSGYRINQTYIKVWPVQYNTQAGIEAALALRDRVDPRSIDAIVIDISDTGRILSADTAAKWDPQTRETADHSLPYIVVSALVDGQVSRGTFDSDQYRNPEKLALVQRVDVRADPQFTKTYPEDLSVRVCVRLQDGSEHIHRIDHPKGHVRNRLSDDEVSQKYQGLVGDRFPRARADANLARLWDLDGIEDLGELLGGFALD
ncbi:MmgE/PrpD family protein, partial [Devosia sp.]|uniref:MmgE/PrpD family protein n=1 Tax=Devosia sp. TaxID=1871048 RepID=UPI002F16C53C